MKAVTALIMIAALTGCITYRKRPPTVQPESPHKTLTDDVRKRIELHNERTAPSREEREWVNAGLPAEVFWLYESDVQPIDSDVDLDEATEEALDKQQAEIYEDIMEKHIR
jgi:hypothetical protein